MITKQQQLEWLAEKYKSWPEQGATSLGLGVSEIGKFAIVNSYVITRKEWQQERDKMQKQAEQPTPGNSWHDRGELPPVGCECEWIDESGVDGAAGVNYPEVGDVVYVCAHKETPGGDMIAIFTWHSGGDGLHVAASRMPSDFHPLRTEREKAIDAACKAVGGVGEDGLLIIERLYDAGLLK